MKSWPKDPAETVSAGELIAPILRVVRKGYRLLRKRPVKSIPYKGYTLGAHELVNCFDPKEAFSKGGLEYAEERGHSLLEVALYVAFQLGIEQGRRKATDENPKVDWKLMESLLDEIRQGTTPISRQHEEISKLEPKS